MKARVLWQNAIGRMDAPYIAQDRQTPRLRAAKARTYLAGYATVLFVASVHLDPMVQAVVWAWLLPLATGFPVSCASICWPSTPTARQARICSRPRARPQSPIG